MYAGPEFPPWNGPGPGSGPAAPEPPAQRRARPLVLHLALLLFPLTAGVFTGAVVPLLLALDAEAGWNSLLMGSAAALLLAAPAAHWLAVRLLKNSTT